MTSRSTTGVMLWSTVAPGASNAAAICFRPAFFVIPDARTVPERGAPGRTT